MTINQAIREIMTLRGIRAIRLAERLGISRPTMSQRLNDKSNWTTDTACSMAKMLDYRVVLVPAEARLPKDSFIIESSDDE